jgi:SAM-dependent methyltransferase
MDSEHSPITYLSAPTPVRMGDWWFDIATADHFWIRRRFDVLRRLADPIVRNAVHAAEIGCGNGLLQREVEDHYGTSVTGFDLNELALRSNVSQKSPLYCYNIHQRDVQFRAGFDLLFLFDVLEHIEDESAFLQSVRFHLAEGGNLLINVPAHQFFHSHYDRAVGHIRRYSLKQLAKVSEQNGFKMRAFTYWGLPLVPLLLVRKLIGMQGGGKSGFDPRGQSINNLLAFLARCEPLPQTLLGASVMAVFEGAA